MTGVSFGTLLAGLLTFVASFSKRVLAYQHVTDTPFPNVIADKNASQALSFPAQFASLCVANSQTRTPSGRRNLDVRYLFGIIACVHDDGL
jgi:hypothetical protein